MFKIDLSAEELELLKRYIKTTPLILVRAKCQAVIMRSKRIPCADIAEIVSRDRRSISRWCKDFSMRRMASIFTGHEDNENASKLTIKQKEEIRDALANPPSAYGIPKDFWDIPSLREYVSATFGVVYESDQSYHFLLTFSNLSFKYPDTFDHRRNEEIIQNRMREIRNEIRPFLEDPSWEVFASDEVRIELEAITRKAWLKKGERTIIKVNRKRESQSYIGFLNQKTFNCHLYELPWQNQEELLKAFPLFLNTYSNKRICIIWDGAGFHKGKSIRNALKKGGLLERVHLVLMPPYAPDHNPIEQVWNEAKKHGANIQRDNLEAAKADFRSYIESRRFMYQI